MIANCIHQGRNIRLGDTRKRFHSSSTFPLDPRREISQRMVQRMVCKVVQRLPPRSETLLIPQRIPNPRPTIKIFPVTESKSTHIPATSTNPKAESASSGSKSEQLWVNFNVATPRFHNAASRQAIPAAQIRGAASLARIFPFSTSFTRYSIRRRLKAVGRAVSTSSNWVKAHSENVCSFSTGSLKVFGQMTKPVRWKAVYQSVSLTV